MFKIPTNTWTTWLSPGSRHDDQGGKQNNEIESKAPDAASTEQDKGTTNTDDIVDEEHDGDATPQANPSQPSASVPSFTLDDTHTNNDHNHHDQDEENERDELHEDEEDERDNLPPPVFPAMNSAQRASAPSSILSVSASTMSAPGLMAPPPPPSQATKGLMPPPRASPVRSQPQTTSTLRVPSTASSLRVPTTGPLPNRGPSTTSSAQSRNSLAPSRIDTPSSRNKVQLTPGHSPLDWATLARSKSLANVPHFMRVTPSMLKHFNGRKDKATGLKKDAWSVFQGKVYNITPYLPFHPGGEGELLRGAGKDGTAMFNDVHPWVNWEGMMGSCLVGVLVSETEESSGLDSLD